MQKAEFDELLGGLERRCSGVIDEMVTRRVGEKLSELHEVAVVGAGAEARSLLTLYQMTANDPHVDRRAVLRKLFEAHGLDASKFVIESA